jgi:co-chaperonin GroES (HSP10)
MIKLLSNPQTETSSPVFKLGDDVICQAYPGEEIYIANIKGNIALCLGYSGKSGNFQQEIPLSNLSLAVEVKAKIEVISTPKILPIEPTPASFKIGDRVSCEDYPGETLEVVKINPFDDDWLYARREWWPVGWPPDLFHVSQLGLITQQTFDSDTFQKPVIENAIAFV